MHGRICVVVFLSLVGIGYGRAASAQPPPKLTLAGGYQQLRGVTDFKGQGSLAGWFGDIGYRLGRAVAIVGEVADHRQTVNQTVDLDGFVFTYHAKPHLQCFFGGVRAGALHLRRVVPFVQAVGGVVRAGGTSIVVTQSPATTQTVTSWATKGALELGGGLDLRVVRRIGLRMGADYFQLLVSGAKAVMRVRVGAVVAIGR